MPTLKGLGSRQKAHFLVASHCQTLVDLGICALLK
jgi:hypothetical protein